MENATDIQYLKEVYTRSTNKYKPRQIKTLLIGEAPPCNLDRFFYFEEVKVQDSLFLEIVGVLYPDKKQRYLKAGRPAEGKAELLEMFAEDGYLLIDLYEVPVDTCTDEEAVASLLTRLEKLIDKTIPIVLIKTNVFDLCYPVLKANGYNVSNERLPFPGSGQQKVFREKFAGIVNA
ncbi:MAG: hypothetical protein EOO10_08730 [Chitinophagaceae bacterium]|nr:MAG: hypothetical protein EOO10_08730 [Chitinophagaceae bacterium]